MSFQWNPKNRFSAWKQWLSRPVSNSIGKTGFLPKSFQLAAFIFLNIFLQRTTGNSGSCCCLRYLLTYQQLQQYP
jgi:hypothetical protein